MRRLFTIAIAVSCCTASFAADMPKGASTANAERMATDCKRTAPPGEFDVRCDCPRLGYRGEIPVPPSLSAGF